MHEVRAEMLASSVENDFSPGGLAHTAYSEDGRRTERPLHILLFSPTLSRMTGADRDWVTLANALGPRKIRLTWAGTEGCEYLRPYLDPAVITRLVDLRLPWFTYLIQDNAYQPRSAWLWMKICADHLRRLPIPFRRLQCAVRNDPIDVVVSNTAAVMIGALFARLYRLPHVWCVKECLDPEIAACQRLARWISCMSQAVVVPSQAVANTFPLGAHVFPDGCDLAVILHEAGKVSRTETLHRLGLPVELPMVAQVGGIVRWKGQHVTAEAFVRMAQTGGRPNFSLLFLGEGDPTYREHLEKILADAPPEWLGVVRFVHFDPADFSYLAAADIVVHPSVLPDPFPNAVREAMILGKPVIGSRNGGIPEMIVDDQTGVLVRPGDPDDLAAALNRLVSFPEQRRRLGTQAQLFATSYFDVQTRKHAFSSLFRQMVNGGWAQGKATITSPTERWSA